MAKPIQLEAEMQVPPREMPFTLPSTDETNEGNFIKDPDTMLILIVLLLACLALALLANAII